MSRLVAVNARIMQRHLALTGASGPASESKGSNDRAPVSECWTKENGEVVAKSFYLNNGKVCHYICEPRE